MNNGFIKLYRAIQDSPAWTSEPFTRCQAWIDIIMLANHRSGFVRIAGRRIDVKRGQLAWSIVNLANRWRWSKGKVLRCLNEWSDDRQIEHQNIVVTTLITITNYDTYQSNDTPDDTPDRSPDRAPDGTPDGHQTVHKQEWKEWKECTRIRNSPLPPLEGGDEVSPVSPKFDSPSKRIQWAPKTGWNGIIDYDIEGWTEAYPACNVKRQLKAMEQWILSHPERAKKKAWMRFITGWLAREQERGGDMRGGQGKTRVSSSESDKPFWE